MSPRQHEEFFANLACVGLSAVALTIGVWIASARWQEQVAREQWTLAHSTRCEATTCAEVALAQWEH